MSSFERSSGCKMHRDPASDKCKFLPLGGWRNTLQQEDVPFPFFRISEHLDMLGVTLKASYTATRGANGDELVTRMRHTVGPWRAGRHMELNMRPHLINSTAFSKMYHRCTTVDLRVGDSKTITSLIKSWLYADMLEKPGILALHRQPVAGGLGLLCIQRRALAFLITSFLETSCNPAFQRNLYHEWLLRYHVLGERGVLPEPTIPPYLRTPQSYRNNFFSTIRLLKDSTNLEQVKVKEVYNFLMSDVIMTDEVDGGGPRTLLPLRVELASPGTDWPRSWRLARQQGLGPTLTSFLFKLLHQLLPIGERVGRIFPTLSPLCTLCQEGVVESLQHALFTCPANQGIPALLLTTMRQYLPFITPAQVLTLNFEVTGSLELPLTWTIASFFLSLWSKRLEKKRITAFKIRSELEASCRILQETKIPNFHGTIHRIISTMFT